MIPRSPPICSGSGGRASNIPVQSSLRSACCGFCAHFCVTLRHPGIQRQHRHAGHPDPVFLLLFAFCFGFGGRPEVVPAPGVPGLHDSYSGGAGKNHRVFLNGLFHRGRGADQAGWASVHVSGNIIDLGVTQLQVVDACSGLRYIFPLLAFGVLYAYFFERETWKRIVCVLSTLPIAILTNTLRIGLTGMLIPHYVGVVAAKASSTVSGVGDLFGCVRFSLPAGKNPSDVSTLVHEGSGCGASPIQRSRNAVRASPRPWRFHGGIAPVVGGLSASTGSLPPINIQGGQSEFPLVFAAWTGRSQLMDPEMIRESGAEEAFNGLTVRGKGSRLALHGLPQHRLSCDRKLFPQPDRLPAVLGLQGHREQHTA